MVDYFADIANFAVVVEAQVAIHFAAATAAIPGEGIPTIARKYFGQALDVVAFTIAFQTMGEDDEFFAAAIQPVEVDEIAVG